MENEVNYGVLTGPPPVGAYVYGNDLVASNITIDPTLWESYYSRGEHQRKLFDTMACVTFSGLNVVEAIFNYHIRNGMFSKENIEWLRANGYLDDNDGVNFSDRFTAKMSDTSHNGNWLWKVADSIRNHGLVPEIEWPFGDAFSWDEYYKEIPEEIKALGLEFKRRFKINYEIVLRKDMKEALTHSPLQLTVHAWEPAVNGVYQVSNLRINHAVSNIKPEWYIYDHYKINNSFIKQVVPDFIFGTDIYKFNVSQNDINDMIETFKLKDKPEIYAKSLVDNKLYWVGGWESYETLLANGWAKPFIEIDSLDAYEVTSRIFGFIE